MTQINAYLGFNGRCREAMEFYKKCLGGDLSLQTYGEVSGQEKCAEGMKEMIMHSALTRKGVLLLMGTDMKAPGIDYSTGTNFALSLNCSSEDEINDFFSKLSDGGKITEPIKLQFWGALFGVLTDRFGFTWMLNYDKNQNHE